MKPFSQKIREARASLCMSQAQFSEATGISQRTIMGYESGEQKASAKYIRLLAKFLHVSRKYLLDDDCENPTEGIEEEAAIDAERENTAKLDVQKMLLDNTALFAGGQLTQKQKDNYFKALMAAYEACRDVAENKESE